MALKKKILITGGAGYIGSWVSRYFLQNNYSVVVVDNLFFGANSLHGFLGVKDFKFIKSDCRDFKNYEEELKNIECVIHLAALVGEKACKINEENSKEINFDLTKNLIQKCADYNVKKFMFMSTASSYGVQNIEEVADENTKLNPVSIYAKTKIDCENFLLDNFSDKLNITIFRPSTVHGDSARMRFDLIVNHLVLDAIKKSEIVVLGPKMWRPLMWVGEPAKVFFDTINADQQKVKSQIFNLGANTENFQKIDIANIIHKILGDKLKVEIIDKDPDLRSYRVDFTKIEKILNYKPQKSLTEVINELIFSIKNNLYANPESNIYRN